METMKITNAGGGLRSRFTRGIIMLVMLTGVLGADCFAQAQRQAIPNGNQRQKQQLPQPGSHPERRAECASCGTIISCGRVNT
jgi:hypothetical protein